MRVKKSVSTKRLKLKSLRMTTLLISTFFISTASAQESINATGGNASGSGGTVSYSVGQVSYTTNSGTNGIVSQGVQQPFEILVISSVEEAKGINLTVSVYPNPTTDYLTLSVADYDISKLSYQLFDMNGRILETKKIESNETKIEMISYLPAIYFVKVIAENKEIKTFKVIKN